MGNSSSTSKQRRSQYGGFNSESARRQARDDSALDSEWQSSLSPPEHHRRSRSDAGSRKPRAEVAPPPYSNDQYPAPPEKGGQPGGSSDGSGAPASSSSRNRLHDIEYLQRPMRQESRENALETLRQYDTVIIMDDSGSMHQDDRWGQAKQALAGLAEVAATYDADGIDIHFLNHSKQAIGVKDGTRVNRLFTSIRPDGLTPIGQKLDELVGDYITKLEAAKRRKDKGDTFALKQIKPINFIVITDGVPTDEPADVITVLARRLDKHHFPLSQVGIQFVQIGNDKAATAFLQELDDDLGSSHNVRDMVDTTPYLGIALTHEMLIKILLGGINRRVDRKGGAAVMYQ